LPGIKITELKRRWYRQVFRQRILQENSIFCAGRRGEAAMNGIIGRIYDNPVIAALKSEEELEDALNSNVNVIFVLHADIFNINRLVSSIKAAGKCVLIHIDFLEGLGRDSKALDYIVETVKPDGIISTRSAHIKHAKDRGIFTIQRFFIVDSMSYDTTVKSIHSVRPDMIEILPGVMPSVVKRITAQIPMPLIAGGLIDSKEDIISVLSAGAIGVSVGKKELWGL